MNSLRVSFYLFALAFLLFSTACKSADDTFIDHSYKHGNPLNAPVFDAFCENTWEFSLLAYIECADIYLYGGMNNQGMLLYHRGVISIFEEWMGPCHRGILPQLRYDYFNCDENKSLAVILHVGSGTETSLQDLHILSKSGDGYFEIINSLFSSDVKNWFSIPMETVASECNQGFFFIFNDNRYFIESVDVDSFISVIYGQIVNFAFENNYIKVTIGIGAIYEYALGRPLFFGRINASLTFISHEVVFLIK